MYIVAVSFDVFFQSFPRNAKTLDEVPDHFAPAPLGSLANVRALLKSALPNMRLAQDGAGVVDADSFSAEIIMGDDDPCEGFMVSLRGGPGGAAIVDAICNVTGFRAVAPGVDRIITSGDEIGESFAGWRKYRDSVVRPQSERATSSKGKPKRARKGLRPAPEPRATRTRTTIKKKKVRRRRS
jgi:hypothetical protein